MTLGFTAADLAALATAIDSSQSAQNPPLPQLPAETLLDILEHVPIDHVLDWRLVCRGFRDAIDGRILYHCVRRMEVIVYLGARPATTTTVPFVTDDPYEEVRMMRARFSHLGGAEEGGDVAVATPVWDREYAVFKVGRKWVRGCAGGVAYGDENATETEALQWGAFEAVRRLWVDEGFASLRWCFQLDHAVLDRSFLPGAGGAWDVCWNMETGEVRMAWRDMLVSFLKSEASLRRLVAAHKTPASTFTYTPTEDCIRFLRRRRLQARLDITQRQHRHYMWSLRLLPPLFGSPRDKHTEPLEAVENEAITQLLRLRRQAGMSARQRAWRTRLAADYAAMKLEMEGLDDAFRAFKGHLCMSEIMGSAALPGVEPQSRNPLVWPDGVVAEIEGVVDKWRAQRTVVGQMKMLLEAANVAMVLASEEGFEDIGSEFDGLGSPSVEGMS